MAKIFNIQEWQDKQRRLFEKEGVPHYTKDGKEWTGATHKMDDKLMTQNPHNEDSEELFHKKDLNEQGFDSRLKAAGGFSDEEFDNITSRDVGSRFPGEDEAGMAPRYDANEGVLQAQDLIEELREKYRNMSDEELDSFSKEMIEHFLNNTAAQAAAKIFFGKRGL